MTTQKPVLAFSGLGKVGMPVYERLRDVKQFPILGVALGGKKLKEGFKGDMFNPSQRDEFILEVVKSGATVVDFSHPDAVRGNLRAYIDNGVPFICGTTGFDEIEYREMSSMNFKAPGIMAPNMALPIVQLQKMLREFGNFEGILMDALESHQKGKADPSGTAVKIAGIVTGLGGDFDFDKDQAMKVYHPSKDGSYGSLQWIRESESQLRHGVPKEYLGGHGFHTYTFEGPNEVLFRLNRHLEGWLSLAEGKDYLHLGLEYSATEVDPNLKVIHNIVGKDIYADGVEAGVMFMQGKKPALYSLEDVL